MIDVNEFRVMIRMDRLFKLHHIGVWGVCHSCKRPVSFVVTVYSDQTPQEAFTWFWESLEIDCTYISKRDDI